METRALTHDFWTYLGPSGAQLLDWSSEMLVGLHPSWHGDTGMCRGGPCGASEILLGAPIRRYFASLNSRGVVLDEGRRSSHRL